MIEVTPGAFALLGVVGSAGIAFGINRAGVNRAQEWVKDVNDELDAHVKADNVIHLELVDRLARIETKIDDLKE